MRCRQRNSLLFVEFYLIFVAAGLYSAIALFWVCWYTQQRKYQGKYCIVHRGSQQRLSRARANWIQAQRSLARRTDKTQSRHILIINHRRIITDGLFSVLTVQWPSPSLFTLGVAQRQMDLLRPPRRRLQWLSRLQAGLPHDKGLWVR